VAFALGSLAVIEALDAGSRREAKAARNMAFLRRWLPRRLRVSAAREVPDWRVTGASPAQAASLLLSRKAEPPPISARIRGPIPGTDARSSPEGWAARKASSISEILLGAEGSFAVVAVGWQLVCLAD
jgi:hypothetical protein